MRDGRGGTMFAKVNSIPRPKFGNLLFSDPNISSTSNKDDYPTRHSSASAASPGYYDRNPLSAESSPYNMSPWNQPISPYAKSPWTRSSPAVAEVTISAHLLRDCLPVVKFRDSISDGEGDTPESCAVCLYKFEGEEEIRRLTNCRHIFHRSFLDRWMDHDQKTCPLCRSPFIPDEKWRAFNERLRAASAVPDFLHEYPWIPGL